MSNYKTNLSTHAVGFNHGNAFVIPAEEVQGFFIENPDSQTTFQYFESEFEAEKVMIDYSNE